MEAKINFSLKKITPIKYKKRNNKIQNYFIQIGDDDDNWFNLKDVYDSIEYGNKKNPITNKIISDENINKIKYLYNNIIEVSYDKVDNEDKLLNDSLEVVENRIDELYNNHEQTYLLLQEHHHLLEKIQHKFNI